MQFAGRESGCRAVLLWSVPAGSLELRFHFIVGRVFEMKRLRIALTADPELPVPPVYYGGIERIVHMLATGLVQKGHEVVVFANSDSATAGRLVGWPGLSSRSMFGTIRNSAVLWQEIRGSKFDIVHSFSRLAYLAPILPSPIPKLMTYQREISPRTVKWAHFLSGGSLEFTSVGEWMARGVKNIGSWTTIPNGVPLRSYAFREIVGPNAPLIFLGRIEEIKGPHLAIEIAKKSGRPLIIAGNIPPAKAGWFETHIKPHIDGRTIVFVGPVDDVQKNELLGKAAALLMPILWDEPFGIVMVEAMACGTPVLGTRRGAVPEVVVDGRTGFVRETVDELAEALSAIDMLDRRACRARVEMMYSDEIVVQQYLETYMRLIGNSARAGAP